jgi:cytoskeletal protein RodZ
MTSIGQKLKEAREEQRLTIEKAFEATRIRVQYLHALEADDLSVMPSPVQARGYLRNYAEYLGLDVTRLLDELREANTQSPPDVVIGPADVSPVEETSTPELPLAPEIPPVEAVMPLIKPKPTRRKKAVSEPADDSLTTPKRRTRKRIEPELQSIIPLEPTNTSSTDNNVVLATEEALPPPTSFQEQSTAEKTVPLSDVFNQENIVGSEISSESTPESVAENISQPATESTSPAETESHPDVSDGLWHSWLNRLTSVLAARNKRRTLLPNESVISEMESETSSAKEETSEVTVLENHSNGESSTQIFKEIGIELRKRRELLSLHLEEVERNTHVKAHYLDALERGAMDELPSTVQTRGMLSNYATFLDLSVDALLLRFADALQARHRERNPQKPMRKPGQPIVANLPPMRSFIAGDMIFGVGIVVLLVGFAIWGVSRVLQLQSEREIQPTAPSISDILLASPNPSAATATSTFIAVEAFPGQPTETVVIPTLSADVNVQVNLVAVERTYMRVIVDGKVGFEGRVVPGTAYLFEATDQVEVLVGSGAAIRIVYNGRDMGLLGSFGQVVSNIYLAGGKVVTPTGMPSPTATITTTPTKTPVPTSTSRFTATPAFTKTPVP